ncbi:insulin-like growth factor-binding protein complex acid labile subunit [Drosophila subobscura]|uniref:insulin-like growth factor-binding protein complex acid labile subunit n=1 Tax=Drosophila subobscura TaxID=7241 RepID=UPI00155A6BAC|nr:insulin-like growth factor-binding protein complex acid labile subunit [Drosophila subobscura]
MYVRNCRVVWCLSLVSVVLLVASVEIKPDLVRVESLLGHCHVAAEQTRCSGFNFESEGERASFDLQTEVRITPDGSTYEVVADDQPSGALIFENCTFVHFPARLLYSLEVTELDMRSCGIRHMRWDSFAVGAEKLAIVLLADNLLGELEDKNFIGAGNLQFLFLNRNKIRNLETDTFDGLQRLQYLDISENQLEELPPRIFDDLESLQTVILAHNLLTTIAGDLFAYNPHLHSVSLHTNRLEDLEEHAFRVGKQHRLHSLDLSHNARLTVLLLNLNASRLMVRNCSLDRVNLYGSVTEVDLSDNRVQELYFPASETLECLVLRNNSLIQMASLTRVPRLRHLDVADNPELAPLPVGWQTPELEHLDLRSTGQQELPVEALQGMPRLRRLDISGNNLTDIDPTTFPLLSKLTNFYLHANNWNCFNLRTIMDMLIRPNGITYTVDTVDPDFPGEYIHGIACMYRQPEREALGGSTEIDSGYSASVESTQLINEELSEVEKLRNELKSVVQHFEAKFDIIMNALEQLNDRMSSIEKLNHTIWNQVTLSV